MPNIAIENLLPHAENANRMPEALLTRLADHIRDTGDYPPLIVRRHPHREDCYQILDGHHRAEALRRIGYDHARCEIWEVDDQRARILLLTLNRLSGSDDPLARGALLRKLADAFEIKQLARQLPDDVSKIEKLIALCEPPPALAEPPDVDSMPQAVTFFLTADQRRRLFERLSPIARDRSEALLRILELDAQ